MAIQIIILFLFIEIDGEDYVIYIDHKTKTIDIVANYYTVEGDDAAMLQHGIDHWTASTANMVFRVGTGEQAIDYKINFVLNNKTYATAEERDEAFENDKSGKAVPYNKDEGGNNSITVENTDAAKKRYTSAHEIGHTLGLGHSLAGLMAKVGFKSNGFVSNMILETTVSMVLFAHKLENKTEHAVGTLVTGEGEQTEGPVSMAKKEVVHDNQDQTPVNFNSGKVVTKTIAERK